MHMVLANAAIHLNALRGTEDEDITILTHKVSAIKSVNVRLGDTEEQASDEVLGAILGVRTIHPKKELYQYVMLI